MAYVTKLTAIGATKIIGGTLNITHIAVGDSNGVSYIPNGSESALINEVYREVISGLIQNNGQLTMQLAIPTTQGGWWVREAGVFDVDGDLIFIANIPAREKALGVTELTITLLAAVSSGVTVNATVNTGAYVTNDVLQNALDGKIDKVSGKGLSTNDYTNTEKSKLADIETGATTNEAATDMEAKAAIDSDKFMTPETTHVAYGAGDPVALTTSPHNQAITESILSGSTSPMVINLADVTTYPKSKLNRIALTIANLSNDNWTVTPATLIGGTSNETLSITGSTTTSPTYALNATNLPAVTNGTIGSNVFTASANNASAQTFDYVAGGSVEKITPKMTFTNGNVLSIDPTSTAGSTKFNYATSNKVQIGSKVQVDVGGTVSEITVAAGSQIIGGSTGVTGLFSVAAANGVVFILDTTTGKLWTSSDILVTINNTNLTTSVLTSITNVAYFNSKYYLSGFCSGADGVIYQSSDLVNWSIVDTLTGYPRCVVMTNGSILSCAYGKNSYNLLTIRTSTDGSAFTTQTTTLGVSVQGGGQQQGTIIWSGQYQNGYFLIRAGAAILNSTDGINYTVFNSGGDGGYGLGKFGSYFIANQFNASILVASSWGAWSFADSTNRGSVVGQISVNANNTKVCIVASSGNAYYSTTGNTFTTISMGTGYTPVGSNNGQTSAVVGNTIINATTTSNRVNISYDFGLTWASLDLSVSSGYQFTMTSPALAKPAWAALGGQAMQYSVSLTNTQSFATVVTPTYTRSGNVITATYAQVTGVSGDHVQLKALTLNSGDVLSQIGATLTVIARQTINGKTSMTLSAGKVAMMVPTSNGWLST